MRDCQDLKRKIGPDLDLTILLQQHLHDASAQPACCSSHKHLCITPICCQQRSCDCCTPHKTASFWLRGIGPLLQQGRELANSIGASKSCSMGEASCTAVFSHKISVTTCSKALTVFGSFLTLRRNIVPIALVPAPLPASPPEKGFLPCLSFCVPYGHSRQVRTPSIKRIAESLPAHADM